jgi:hypothetical protein
MAKKGLKNVQKWPKNDPKTAKKRGKKTEIENISIIFKYYITIV